MGMVGKAGELARVRANIRNSRTMDRVNSVNETYFRYYENTRWYDRADSRFLRIARFHNVDRYSRTIHPAIGGTFNRSYDALLSTVTGNFYPRHDDRPGPDGAPRKVHGEEFRDERDRNDLIYAPAGRTMEWIKSA